MGIAYGKVVVEEFGKGHTPADWIGEQVTGRTGVGDDIVGTLAGITEHGIVVEVRHRGNTGPSYYGWRDILWMYPDDRQERRSY